jgi:FMN phosphatase YigB (HAD superfamily)
MKRKRLLLSDIDNTLFNWVDYFGPSFRSMIHALARQSEFSESTLIGGFRDLYERYGTTEYSFIIQQLPLFSQHSSSDRDALVHLATVAFGRTRRKYLQPYAGVVETLRWCRDEGYALVAITNAPMYAARSKLHRLGLSALFDGIVAWQGNDMPEDELSVRYGGKGGRHGYMAEWPVELSERKPSTAPFVRAINEAGVDADSTWVVGDSVASDIEPALKLGARPFWARYGLTFDRRNLQTVTEVTPGGRKAVEKAYEKRRLPGVTELAEFSELRDHLPASRMALF